MFIGYCFQKKNKEIYITTGDFKNIVMNVFKSYAEIFDWDGIIYVSSMDDKLEFLEERILGLFNIYAEPCQTIHQNGKYFLYRI